MKDGLLHTPTTGDSHETYEKTENLKALINRMGELQDLQRKMETVKIDTTGKK